MFSISEADSAITVTLSHAPVNAVDEEWLGGLTRIVGDLAKRKDIAVVRIRSDLKAFCAGANLKLIHRSLDGPTGVDAMVKIVTTMQAVFQQIEHLPQVTIAEISGSALGGGLELALACDLRIAATTAVLGLPEIGLGLLPAAGGTQRLTRLVGPGLARRMILSAETLSGEQAAALGLVNWAVIPERLQASAEELALRIGQFPPNAIAACKRCLAAAQEPGTSGYLIELLETRRLYLDEQTRTRLTAFINSRKQK